MNAMDTETAINWAQCDSCSKWRKLPSDYPLDQLPNDWVCSMNPNKKFSSCDIPEEAYNDIEKLSIDNNLPIDPKCQLPDLHPDTIPSTYAVISSAPIPRAKLDTGIKQEHIPESTVTSTCLPIKPLDAESGNCLTTKYCKESLLNLQIPPIPLKTGIVEIPPIDAKEFNYYNLNDLLMKVDKIELPQLSDLPKVTNTDISNIAQEIKTYPSTDDKQKISHKDMNNTHVKGIISNGHSRKTYTRSCNYGIKDNNKVYDNCYSKRYDKKRQDTNASNRYNNFEKYENETYNSYSGRTIKPSRHDDYIKTESKYKPSTSNNFNLRGRRGNKSYLTKKTKKEILPLSLVNWVQCEGCKKWRQLPSHVNVEKLPDNWYCKMNIWDPPKADCSVPEDPEPLPCGADSNSSAVSLPSNQLSKTITHKGKRKKHKKVEQMMQIECTHDFSNVHYIDCPNKDYVAGHPVGDRLVLYSQSNSDMSVCKTLGDVAVFSKYTKDPNLDKKRPPTDPLVLSFGCKTEWNLDTTYTMVTERQIESELEKVEKEEDQFSHNGLAGGLDKLLQLCPNLRGQVGKRKIIPSNWPNKLLFTNIYPMKNDIKTVHRQVDNEETFEKLSAWMKSNKKVGFSPNSPYANMLLYSAVEHTEG